MKTKSAKQVVIIAVLVLFILNLSFTGTLLTAGPSSLPERPADDRPYIKKQGDQELAYLLVRLELRTRGVIAGHYGRSQSPVPGVDRLYQRSLAKNLILPAAVADRIFADEVPHATGGRAWVKMVVDEPRNPHNRGDDVALEMLAEMKKSATFAERTIPEAYYYGEPIIADETCLRCHGEPRGQPDPSFPQYQKNGWRPGQTVGAVIARVAPSK
jgi:hypothetical protein